MRNTPQQAGAPYVAQRRSTGPGSSLGTAPSQPLHEAPLGLPGPDGSDVVHSGQSPEGQPSSTPSEQMPTEDGDEDTEISEDVSAKEMVRSGGRSSALVKRKTTALMERMAMKEAQQPPSLAQGVNELLNLDIHHLKKRGRGEGSDSAAEPEVNRRHRRQKNDDFNASSLIGSIFMRVQGTKAPAPLVYFEEDINAPQWFKESIDGVQPVLGSDDFDPEQVNLESMGKLVEGNVLPATLGEVAAYFTHVLGDPRTNKEITPRVLIAIQCDRAKGWFTYKRDNDNSNFVPVVLCAAENGRGLEEVSPAHFEVHRAQCAQKKWRQSFKVLGAQKLHKVTSLAQAALGDVLRHLERILGAGPPPAMPRILDANGNPLPAPPRILSAAQHPTFRQPSSSEQAAAEEGIVRNTGTPREREMVPPRPSPSMALTVRDRGPMSDGERDDVRRLLSSANTVEHMRDLNHHNAIPMNARIPGHPIPPSVSPGVRPPMAAGGRPTHPGVPIGVPQQPMVVAGGSRMMVGGKPMGPVLRRHTEDPAAAVAARLVAGDAARGLDGRGLDLLASAASTAITSPKGGMGPTGVQASLLAAALSGVSFNELLSLVIDNTTRKQQHQEQTALLQRLAALQAQAAQAEKIEIAAAIAGNGVPPAPRSAAAGPSSAPAAAAAAAGGGPAVVPPPALSRAECEAIDVMIKAVRGPDITHAVRGILQHVAMQYAGEQPADVAPALAEAVHRAAVAEGLPVQEENVEIPEGVVADPETIALELQGAVAAAAAAAQEDGVAGEMEVEEMDKVAEMLQ